MRGSWSARIVAGAICLGGLCLGAGTAAAQQYTVTTAGDLAAAIQAANAWTGPAAFAINFQTSGTIQPAAQMVIGLTLSNTSGLVINGNGATIDMAAANAGAGDRAFFIANGSIVMSNLTIANGKAVGGNGGNAAGGGAGLGGGIFVANAAAIPGTPELPTRVSLTDVFFTNNQANGGNGAGGGSASYEGWGGGGGGMGGNGGNFYRNGVDTSGGGGGGFGFGANGGDASPDGVAGNAGAMTIAGAAGGGSGGFNGAAGGAAGGGGGGGNDGFFQRGAGGGGGVGGQAPGSGSSAGYDGGTGGFGGGGGGSGNTDDTAGAGGFGGGGGSGDGSSIGGGSAGGAGGFGGGGGGNGFSAGSLSSPGGFGGGPGLANNTGSTPYGSTGGGGGAGLGGAVFVMGGASLAVNFSGANSTPLYTNNSVSGGSGGYVTNAGSAYGPNVFLGGDVTYTVTSSTLAVSGLGGGGNLADPNVANNRSDPNANGGLVKNGNGTLALSGWNTYSGPTTVNAGVLATSGSQAAMMGTSAVTINSGATLVIGQSNGVNADAGVAFNGGTLQLATTLTQTFAGLTVSQPSVLDFGSTMSALTMGTLSLAEPLAIWNFTSTARAVSVTSGTYSGSLSNVTFYSDAGQTSLGQTYLVGTFLTPQTINVANGADLTAAVASANAMTGSATIVLAPGATIQPAAQSVISLNAANTAGLSIVGNSATIDMSQANGGAGDRAFFIAGGNVTLSDLTIANGVARGGDGADGGGGGAGLGGGIFVAAGNQIPSSTITLPTDVTLANVTFAANTAVGGAGALVTAHAAGGGGGLGGAAGDTSGRGGGGGGGFGFGASGGSDSAGAAGAAVFTASGGGAAASGESGGANGGGGGGSGTEERSGGGGGIAGASATTNGGLGSGGWGGGGGGASFMGNAGDGGFGGGGGGGFSDANAGNGTNGGWGGFGGGGGYGLYVPSSGGPGPGGFGGGRAAEESDVGGPGGGGGMAAGGGAFVMAGATLRVVGGVFTANSVVSGSGNVNGSTYGTDLFLGANTTFDVPTTLTLRSLGGAGNVNDTNVYNQSVSAAQLAEAQGGVIKTGNGTLTLTGTSFYSGITTVHSGTLALAAVAKEQGTTVVTVGQNAGDVATLVLGSSSTLNLGGFNGTSGTDAALMIAQAAGSTGTVVIGSGAGSSGPSIGAREFTGGAGNATLRFTQQYAAGSGSNSIYPFLTSLTGTLGLVQDGAGTTLLQPLYGTNTFSGPVTVNSGTLATTGPAAALAGATSIAVNAGAALVLGQNNGIDDLASLTLAGGILQTGTSLSETLGALNVTAGTSLIDFLSNASTMTFSSLSLGGSLAIWNYSGTHDVVTIASGTATGSLAQITFYGDSGSTFLGYGGFDGTRLVPVAVPEPTTIALAVAGLTCASGMLRRKRFRNQHTLLVCLALVGGALSCTPASAQGFSTVTTPIQVPLHWRHINGDTSGPRKLGIYATLGGGSMPQLFEFDTGGDGFYATYATGSTSPWWGPAWTTTGGTFSQTYDSGHVYTGTAATTTVQLFASGTSSVPLLTAADTIVGQTTSIIDTKHGTEQLWPLPSGTSPPPIEQVFYGDFGMAPKRGQAGIDQLAAQLLYGPGLTAGFRVHASDESPWVQFGLSAADTALVATSFALNRDVTSGTSPAGVLYYENLVVTGSLSVIDGTREFKQPTGFIFDTGASTTIHSGTNIQFPLDLTKDAEGKRVKDLASVVVSGSSLVTGGWPAFMDLTASAAIKVDVQYKDGPYYLNTGIAPFTQYDIIYDLSGATLTMAAVPEPSTLVIALAGLAGIAARGCQLRRRRRA